MIETLQTACAEAMEQPGVLGVTCVVSAALRPPPASCPVPFPALAMRRPAIAHHAPPARPQDSHGLHLYSKGNVPEASGSVAEIVAHAQVLAGDDGAVVRIESAQRVVLLSKSDGVTTALFMAGGS